MRKLSILSLFLCAALLVGTAGAAFTAPEKMEGSTIWGTVASIDGSAVRLTNNSGQGYEEIIIRMNETAPIIDAVSGTAVKLADVKIGQTAYITISPAVAQSMPPQGNGLGMVVNLPADYRAPQFAVIDRVTTDKDGNTEILTSDRSLLGRITADTALLRYVKPGEAAILSLPTTRELTPGSVVYLWYGAATKSIPAQANLNKVLIVPSLYAGDVSIAEGAISVNAVALPLSDKTMPLQNTDGSVLVPLRLTAEAAGWTLSWTANDKPITLTKDKTTVTVTLGSSDVRIGDQTYTLPQEMQLRGGVSFVDSQLLTQALNLYTSIAS